MKIAIVTPGHPGSGVKSFPPALTAPYLAALATPFAHSIRIYDLAVEPFDFYGPIPDVAMFTTTMAQSDHIFRIARFLKLHGSLIILGGPHATLAYGRDPRIQEIADTVILGEAEKALPQSLRDLIKGGRDALKPLYHTPVNSLSGMPFARLDLLDSRRYYSVTCLIGTRGCPNRCAYCSIKSLYGRKYLRRPVEEVIEEIKYQTSRPGISWTSKRFVTFWDDNPAGDLDWFHTLLEKLVPLKKSWISQMCLNVAESSETVRLMKRSGCLGIFAGIESVNPESLKGQNKNRINRIDRYTEQCHTFLRHGIQVIGAFMFGFDEDTPRSLTQDTLSLATRMGLTLMQCHLNTPYPHLGYYETLLREGRLLTEEAKYFNGYTVVHRPSRIHPALLQDAFLEVRQRFYSLPCMLHRMVQHRVADWPKFLFWQLLFRKPNYSSIPNVDVNLWHEHLNTL